MNRRSAGIAVLVVAIAGAIGGAATAFGSADEKDPITARDYYTDAMSLGEVSRASQGAPGERVPPCPDETTVVELKEQGLPVGPCDPFPETGSPLVLPSEVDEADEVDSSRVTCAGWNLRSGDPEAISKVEGPCGPGARILDVQPYRDSAGTACAKVTYVVAAGEAPEESSSCVGDPIDSRLPHVAVGGK